VPERRLLITWRVYVQLGLDRGDLRDMFDPRWLCERLLRHCIRLSLRVWLDEPRRQPHGKLRRRNLRDWLQHIDWILHVSWNLPVQVWLARPQLRSADLRGRLRS